jgi:hypothetical protein
MPEMCTFDVDDGIVVQPDLAWQVSAFLGAEQVVLPQLLYM